MVFRRRPQPRYARSLRRDEEEYDDEEEFDEEEDEEPSDAEALEGKGRYARRFSSKNFKDLNPKDRKARKEPAKPWGQKERLLVLTLIILTTGISGYLALTARDWKLPGLPRMKMPVISLSNLFKEETIVIEGNNIDKRKADKVIGEFKTNTEGLSGVYGLYVIRLNNGSGYGVNGTEIFQAASLIKLPVMVGMYQESEAGALNLDSKYKLKNSDKVAGSGSLYGKPAGYETSYRNLIKLMGKESDNTAFNICRKYFGETKISKVITKIGLKNTNLENNETTPEDVGRLLQELWTGNLINQKNKDELLGFMTNTIYENWLAKGLPENIRFAHKYGREVHVVNDAGIVFSDEPYVVVVMSKGIVEKEADGIFPKLSKMVYEVETGD